MLEKMIIMTTMVCLTVLAEQNTVLQTLENGTADRNTFQNPIISGFNPDPSICRVGEDYYLVTSTFEFFPGIPVYHSKDLVNWRLIGHALSEPQHLNLDGLDDHMGLFAPSIRHHDGTFHMITTLVTGSDASARPRGNFVVTATNPAGPWQLIGERNDIVTPACYFGKETEKYLEHGERKGVGRYSRPVQFHRSPCGALCHRQQHQPNCHLRLV